MFKWWFWISTFCNWPLAMSFDRSELHAKPDNMLSCNCKMSHTKVKRVQRHHTVQHSSTQALVYHVPQWYQMPLEEERTHKEDKPVLHKEWSWLVTQRDNNYDNYDTVYTTTYNTLCTCTLYTTIIPSLPYCTVQPQKTCRRQLVVLIFTILMYCVNLYDLIKAFNS